MNLARLKTELAAGHLGTGAYDADDAVAAAQVNARNLTDTEPIDIEGLREWASTNGRATKMFAAVTAGATEDERNAAYLLDTIFKSQGSLDLANPAHVELVDALVPKVWSIEDRDDLITKATVEASRADILGLGKVSVGNVRHARAM